MKKSRNSYLGNPGLDVLARTDLELLSELWILRDRFSVLERVLTDKGVLTPSELDEFVPDRQLSLQLDAERDDLVHRVVGSAHVEEYGVDSLKRHRRKSQPS